MRFLLVLFLLITIPCFAGNIVYYNENTGDQIVDVSGKKSIEEIKREFGEGNYQSIILGANESAKVVDGKLIKYDYIKENEEIWEDKRVENYKADLKEKKKLLAELEKAAEDDPELKALLDEAKGTSGINWVALSAAIAALGASGVALKKKK
jgi:hypothetical protein